MRSDRDDDGRTGGENNDGDGKWQFEVNIKQTAVGTVAVLASSPPSTHDFEVVSDFDGESLRRLASLIRTGDAVRIPRHVGRERAQELAGELERVAQRLDRVGKSG